MAVSVTTKSTPIGSSLEMVLSSVVPAPTCEPSRTCEMPMRPVNGRRDARKAQVVAGDATAAWAAATWALGGGQGGDGVVYQLPGHGVLGGQALVAAGVHAGIGGVGLGAAQVGLGLLVGRLVLRAGRSRRAALPFGTTSPSWKKMPVRSP